MCIGFLKGLWDSSCLCNERSIIVDTTTNNSPESGPPAPYNVINFTRTDIQVSLVRSIFIRIFCKKIPVLVQIQKQRKFVKCYKICITIVKICYAICDVIDVSFSIELK